jgi:hypothetical protein
VAFNQAAEGVCDENQTVFQNWYFQTGCAVYWRGGTGPSQMRCRTDIAS